MSHRPTISHGFLAAGPTDVRQARAVAPIDAPAPVVALPADVQGQGAECTYYVPLAVAAPA